jgi:uncharacterized membrane protein YbhN (UPF0104 family)
LKINKSYKYINLLIRFVIGAIAVYFIYFRIAEDFLIDFYKIETKNIDLFILGIVLILMFLNWGIEAVKWRFTIRNIEEISIFKSFKLIFTGITLGFLTPNRIGEIPARALLLNGSNVKEITLKTTVASFSQLLITLFFGIIGFCFTFNNFSYIINPIVWIVILSLGLLLLLLVYFRTNKLESIFNRSKFIREKELFRGLSGFSVLELFNILLLSLLRYIVFVFQYYLVLKAFGVYLSDIYAILLIPVCFMVASFIPTILISEIGIRGSVALFVFGTISNMDIQIILASMVLWLINIALPILLGLYNLKDLKLIK